MTKSEAREFITQVCRDYRRSLPAQVSLYQSVTRKSSSGRWWGRCVWKRGRRVLAPRLHVTLGYGGDDHKEIILHEIAHHLRGRTKSGRREAHSVRFWQLHYELCRRYGVEPDHKRNVAYKAKAEDGRAKAVARVGDGLDSLRELLTLG